MMDNSEGVDAAPVARIANEFAAVTVRQVDTGAGRRLELYSELTGGGVRLDATILEALCGMSAADLTRLTVGDDTIGES